MITGITLEAVAVVRGGRILFENLNARVGSGRALTVTGPNGAGKTSLLRAIAGLVRLAAGRVAFEGCAEPAEARRLHCHLVGHQDGLKSSRTAHDELVFHARWCGATRQAALAAAERLGLAPHLAVDVRRLSAGQKRRLALARLLAAPRALWLLDEALAPLDAGGRALMGEIMAEHLSAGGLIIAAAHDPLPIAAATLDLDR